MVQVLTRVRVHDFAKFIGVFSTRGADMRKKHGCLGARVYRVPSEEGEVVILFEWASREAFDAFISDPEVKQTMQSSGTVTSPQFTILAHVADLPN